MHWLAIAAQRAGIAGAEQLTIALGVSRTAAWNAATRGLELTEQQLVARIAATLRIRVADFEGAEPAATKRVPEKLARRYHVVPLKDDGHTLTVATCDPTDLAAEQAVSFAAGRRAVFELAGPEAIALALKACYSSDQWVETLLDRVDADVEHTVRIVEEVAPEVLRETDVQSAPVVKLTNVLLREAVLSRASDLHVEPGPNGGAVRLRVDGVMREYMQLPIAALNRVVSRIKVLSKLDIADRTRPQDGRTRISVAGETYDLRVSTVPTRDSEKCVVRVLRPDTVRTLPEAHIPEPELTRLRQLLTVRSGIVLVTGPTGSGKTTTLYAGIREILQTGAVNTITIEDPIEYELAGATQIQVDPKRDITFASALRAVLRQDPDVIFVGEIRDLETATVAVHAALTGHLVLATLHANDAVGAVARLVDIGLDRASIAASLRGSVAQRLVRRICPECAQRIETMNPDELALATAYGTRQRVRAVGCGACGNSGYRGRLPAIEVAVFGAGAATQIAAGATAEALQAGALESGLRTMRDVALDWVRAELTTLEEVARVVGADGDDASAGVKLAPLVDGDVAPWPLRPERRSRPRDRRGRFRRRDDEASIGPSAEEQREFPVDTLAYLRELRHQTVLAVSAVIGINSVLARVDEALRAGDLRRRDAHNDELFRACESFLMHAETISRLLWPAAPSRRAGEPRSDYRARCATDPRRARARVLREALRLPDTGHPLRRRRLREHISGYVDAFDAWQAATAGSPRVFEYVGPAAGLMGVAPANVLRWYDVTTHVVRFRGEEFDIPALVRAIRDVQQRVEAVLDATAIARADTMGAFAYGARLLPGEIAPRPAPPATTLTDLQP